MKLKGLLGAGAFALVAALAMLWAFRDEAPETAAPAAKPASPTPNAASNPPPAKPSDSREALVQEARRTARPLSRAPWAATRQRYLQGDYAWIVANARSDPKSGSYALAMRAISQCTQARFRGTLDEQRKRLLAEGGPNAELKVQALEKLNAPCAVFTDIEALQAEYRKLGAERATFGDAINVTIADGATLRDGKLEVDLRNSRARQLLELDDAVAANEVQAALTLPGGTLDGIRVPDQDLRAYRGAWQLTMCSYYGDCQGPDNTQSQWNCLLSSRCDYQPTWWFVAQLSDQESTKVADYYRKIEDRLQRREFGAFGVGSPNP
jgi:hypothetical protein